MTDKNESIEPIVVTEFTPDDELVAMFISEPDVSGPTVSVLVYVFGVITGMALTASTCFIF